MSSMVSRMLAIFLLATTHSPAARTAPVPLITYRNLNTGVTFRYPPVWKTVAKPESQTQPFLIEQGIPVQIDVEFSPKGNLYEKTNLVGLDFLYATAPAASADACGKLGKVDGSAAPKKAVINGVSYQRSAGGDAGMCHQIYYEVYSTYRDGVCHLFEKDFMTLCPGVQQGTRGLTASETRALQRHLDAIMQSVTIHVAR